MGERKRTKIVATIGPASDNYDALKKLIENGVDVFRLNFSHGAPEEHAQRASLIRKAAIDCAREVGILADLQGPKIRIAKFKEGKINLQSGAKFCIDAALDKSNGNQNCVGTDYEHLAQDLIPGDKLLLDDGRLSLLVEKIIDTAIYCQVIEGGVLSNNKGINKEGGGLSAPALTDRDKLCLKTIADMNIDYVAVSFVRSAADIEEARDLLAKLGSKPGIIAKIERKESLDVIDEIINASDAVMVARGDLGVEISDAELPAEQKKIIGRARALDKAVITATQMMESMIENSIPTRAEVFDVANAVLDGTDAVMLSAETATGKNPDKVVAAMARICLGAEKQKVTQVSGHRLECYFNEVSESIAMASMYVANHTNVKAIVALTESGYTPLLMSRIRSGIPIFGLSRHPATLRRMTLFRGVYPIYFDTNACARTEVNKKAIEALKQAGVVKDGDLVILTKGDHMGVHGSSNTMKLLNVGSVL